VTFFGQKAASPFWLAPIPDQGLYHPDAELNLVRASAHSGIPLVLASKTTKPLKDIFAERDKLAAEGKGKCQCMLPRWACRCHLTTSQWCTNCTRWPIAP
jgi:isopentenyl diphosphate isomerase/L-lactate dehydrogenase-like FMN-dependent dehydrogenase